MATGIGIYSGATAPDFNPDISYDFYCGDAIRSLAALRLFGLLDILSNMPSSPSLRAPYTPDHRNTKIALRRFLAQGKKAGSAHSQSYALVLQYSERVQIA